MSRGQKPRWRPYFPRMKDRGRYRRRGPRIVVYDQHWRPVWPPVLRAQSGQWVRIDHGRFVINGRVLGRDGFWHDEEA